MFGRLFAAAAIAIIALFGAMFDTPAAVPGAFAASSPNEQAEAFLKSAEALYRASLRGDAPAVRRLLIESEAKFRALPMQRIATAEGVEALARSFTRMKRAVAAVSGNTGNWRAAAAELRLAADALAHPANPLWHQYRTVLKEDVDELNRTVGKHGPSPESLTAFERVKAHYGLIRTSVLLLAEPYLTERADSVLRYGERVLSAHGSDPGLLADFIPSLRESMEELFPEPRQSRETLIPPVAGPPWGWSALMGVFIVTVLSWAGWQRYRNTGPVTPRGILPPERRERH